MAIPRKLTANFVATEVDDEILIVDLDGGFLFSLSGTARAVWHAIDGVSDAALIAESMAIAHDGDVRVIAEDIDELLTELERAALVELV